MRHLGPSARSGSLQDRFELFHCGATLAAQAKSSTPGFRQRDVRFLIELFSNWVDRTLGHESLNLSNTQVARFLQSLTRDGFAKVHRVGKQPYYTLTRLGLLDLAGRMIERSENRHPDQFYFLYYFVRSYRPKIMEMIEEQGKQFPPSLRIELSALLDADELLLREIKWTETEITRLQGRIHDSAQSAKVTRKMLSQGIPQKEIFLHLEEAHPYELNSQMSLGELLAQMPPSLARWEMEHGNLARIDYIFQPSVGLLRAYLEGLRHLKNQDCKS